MIAPPFYSAPAAPASIATLLLHFDGANNSTTFIDSSPNAFPMTTVGNAKITTSDSVAGGACGTFDGNGDRVVSPSSALLKINGDFTVEGWIKWTALGGIVFNLADNGIEQIRIATGGFNQVTSSAGNAPNNSAVTGVWKYLAMTKQGDAWRLFIDGLLVANSSFTFAHANNTTAYFAGISPSYGHCNCLLDEWRIRNGVCLYTADFTPPTPPLS